MEKNFDEWNNIQKNLRFKKRLHFHIQQVWICHLGVNIGSEQDGKGKKFLRPIVIVKKIQ